MSEMGANVTVTNNDVEQISRNMTSKMVKNLSDQSISASQKIDIKIKAGNDISFQDVQAVNNLASDIQSISSKKLDQQTLEQVTQGLKNAFKQELGQVIGFSAQATSNSTKIDDLSIDTQQTENIVKTIVAQSQEIVMDLEAGGDVTVRNFKMFQDQVFKVKLLEDIISSQKAQIEKQIQTDNSYTQTVGFGLGGLLVLIIAGGIVASMSGDKKKKK